MGREIKRVPIGWDWPLDKVWEGFRNPHYAPCPDQTCEGGQTYGGWWLEKICYFIGMVAEASRSEKPMHPWMHEFPLAPTQVKPDVAARGNQPGPYDYQVARPTPDFADLVAGLIGGMPRDDLFGMGFTSDRYKVWRKLVEVSGVPSDWGSCKTCGGDGIDPAVRDEYESWERYDPPAGDGWQVWETVSEGSPITPVFNTADELVDYLATKGTIWDQRSIGFSKADGPWRREAAEAFVKSGWAPSGMYRPGAGFLIGGRDADKMG